jgi:RimJ/RimL family protein N-acetyltransferase
MIKIVESFINNEIIEAKNRWENDPKINHFTTPNFEEEPLKKRTFETTYIENVMREEAGYSYDYLVFDDELLIGECNIMIDPNHLEKKVPGTGWVGLLIGEEKYRGKGIGRTIMEFLELECKNLDLVRIELGVFEFNKGALKLYEKMGYVQFAELDNFTFYNGKWHKDIRLEKSLT